jgi:hypothetical protein
MTARDNGGPAFPQNSLSSQNRGMTLREYAAIKLCVPDSGLDWLDDMIRQAQRDRFAGQALAGILGGGFADTIPHDDLNGGRDAAAFAYQYADAVIAERKGGAA